MTYIRSHPLIPTEASIYDLHNGIWDSVMSTLLDRPEVTVLSWPCPDCGDHRLKCTCTEGDDQ